MNKRLKKKANSYRKLTYKQRIKNQGKTIRRLYLELQELNKECEVRGNSINLAYDIISTLDNKIEIMQEIIDEQKQQIGRLQAPWWKRGIRCK